MLGHGIEIWIAGLDFVLEAGIQGSRLRFVPQIWNLGRTWQNLAEFSRIQQNLAEFGSRRLEGGT